MLDDRSFDTCGSFRSEAAAAFGFVFGSVLPTMRMRTSRSSWLNFSMIFWLYWFFQYGTASVASLFCAMAGHGRLLGSVAAGFFRVKVEACNDASPPRVRSGSSRKFGWVSGDYQVAADLVHQQLGQRLGLFVGQ